MDQKFEFASAQPLKERERNKLPTLEQSLARIAKTQTIKKRKKLFRRYQRSQQEIDAACRRAKRIIGESEDAA